MIYIEPEWRPSPTTMSEQGLLIVMRESERRAKIKHRSRLLITEVSFKISSLFHSFAKVLL